MLKPQIFPLIWQTLKSVQLEYIALCIEKKRKGENGNDGKSFDKNWKQITFQFIYSSDILCCAAWWAVVWWADVAHTTYAKRVLLFALQSYTQQRNATRRYFESTQPP